MNWIVNDIQFIRNLTCVLWTPRICNLYVRFSKYVTTSMFLVGIVANGYKQFCNQALYN